jgi:hypothetical protein
MGGNGQTLPEQSNKTPELRGSFGSWEKFLRERAASGSKVTDKATATSTTFDSNKANNSATVVTNVQ